MPIGTPGTTPNSPTTGGVSPTTGAAAGLLASPNWQSHLVGSLLGGADPTLAKYGLKTAETSAALALLPKALGVTEQELEQQAGFSFATALLGYKNLGLQSQALATQAGTAAGQQGIEQAQYGITAEKYGQEQATAALTHQQKQLGLESGAAGSGTLGTVGSAQAQQVAQQQYQWQAATIYRQQQLAALGQQSEQLGYKTKEAGFENAQAQLKLAAQQQGLSVQEASDQLAFGLQQLGVKMTPTQLAAGIATSETSGAKTLAGLGSQASLIAGLGPNFLAGVG